MRRVLRFLKEAVLLEVALYRSLVRWVARRPDVPADATPVGYARLVVPVMWLWIFASGAEVVVVEVVLRSTGAGWAETARLPLLVIGIWGVLWMVGMLAGYRVRPHLLLADRARLRVGPRTWAEIPYDAIRSVESVEAELPGVVRTLHHEGEVLLLGVSSRTNLQLSLHAPVTIASSRGPVAGVTRIGFWVDEPRTTGPLLRERAVRSSV